MEFFTIGVYNSTEKTFFEKLINSKIDTFCDLRQRRGVRGAKYSFVNSKRLQGRLRELNINYVHVPDLAPTAEIREVQKKSDRKNRDLKTARHTLAEDFVAAYKEKIVECFDFDALVESLGKTGCLESHFFVSRKFRRHVTVRLSPTS